MSDTSEVTTNEVESQPEIKVGLSPSRVSEIVKAAVDQVTFVIEKTIEATPLKECADMLKRIFPQTYHTWGSTSDTYISFKCKTIEEVTPILRYITLCHNLKQEGGKVQNGLTADWVFKRRDVKSYCKLNVTVDFSGGPCRMEKVGEETKVVPIYEMKCGDSEPTVTEAAPEAPKTEDSDCPF